MPYFWAIFKKIGTNVARYDTRIYLNSIEVPKEDDFCIGAIVGKNPGSAKANDTNNTSLQQINLDGVKLLPTVRNILIISYEKAGRKILSGEYIQVLNLFYLCKPELGEAIDLITKHGAPTNCASEFKEFPWVWYVWGGKNEALSQFKVRFNQINTKTNFFFNKAIDSVVIHIPNDKEFAKHTQGLRHDAIVPYITKLVKNGLIG